MKSKEIFASIAAGLICLSVLVTASSAATPILALPRGLAVDAQGNLYVANSGGNNILVYGSGYGLQKSKTISAGVSVPWGVAFDAEGDLWVANNASNNITEYDAGVLNPTTIITKQITAPEALAFDGLGNLWVQNNATYLTVYEPSYIYASPASLLQSISPGGTIYGIAVAARALITGSPDVVSISPEFSALLGGTLASTPLTPYTGFAMASDVSGRFYMANLDGSVILTAPAQSGNGQGVITFKAFLQLPFTPSGIAVDNVRNRVYFSNYNGNSISVYNTAGTLLHVIQ